MVFELVIVWLVCGLITSIILANKGRQGASWSLLSFLLGPVGVLLALVVSPLGHD